MLALISVGFLYLSYRHPNTIVFETESIVAFVGALVLILKDSTRSVQLRLVTRMVVSSNKIIDELARSLGPNREYHYLAYGPDINDVFVAPKAALRSVESKTAMPAAFEALAQETQRYTPPGRGFAELFDRELGVDEQNLEGVMAELPRIISESFELAASATTIRDGSRVEVTLVRPLLKESCAEDGASLEGRIGCMICSMTAILLCKYSGSSVIAEGCKYTSLLDQSTCYLRFEETTKESSARVD